MHRITSSQKTARQIRGEEMSLEKDAAFLAGFIVGQYDIKGEEKPPEFIRAVIDRCIGEATFIFKAATVNSGSIIPRESAEKLDVDDKLVVNMRIKENNEINRLATAIVEQSKSEDECVENDNVLVRKRREISPEIIADLQKKRAEGMSASAIARSPQYNVTRQTIINWFKKIDAK